MGTLMDSLVEKREFKITLCLKEKLKINKVISLIDSQK